MNCPFDGKELKVFITANGGCYTKCECGWVSPVLKIPKDVETWCDRRPVVCKPRRKTVKRKVTTVVNGNV